LVGDAPNERHRRSCNSAEGDDDERRGALGDQQNEADMRDAGMCRHKHI
jgi:hypothetical protein